MLYRCRACGAPLSNGSRLYCSEKCRQRGKRMKTRKNCQYCGKEFLTFRKNMQKYCTKSCSVKRQRQRGNYIGRVNPLLPYVRMDISCKGAKV